MTGIARSKLLKIINAHTALWCLMKHPQRIALVSIFFIFIFPWALRILNRRHWNSSAIHQKWFFSVDLVSHTAIAKNTVVLKTSQRRWRWHCWLQHALSLMETCSISGSGSIDQGHTEEFPCDNFCRNFSLNTDNELSLPDSAEWHGWEVQQIWQLSYLLRHV